MGVIQFDTEVAQSLGIAAGMIVCEYYARLNAGEMNGTWKYKGRQWNTYPVSDNIIATEKQMHQALARLVSAKVLIKASKQEAHELTRLEIALDLEYCDASEVSTHERDWYSLNERDEWRI